MKVCSSFLLLSSVPPPHLNMGAFSDYCVVEFTVRNEVGSLTAALSVFKVSMVSYFLKVNLYYHIQESGIKIFGINTLKEDFSRHSKIGVAEYQMIQLRLRHHQTTEQIHQLKDKLKATGFVVDGCQFKSIETPSMYYQMVVHLIYYVAVYYINLLVINIIYIIVKFVSVIVYR